MSRALQTRITALEHARSASHDDIGTRILAQLRNGAPPEPMTIEELPAAAADWPEWKRASWLVLAHLRRKHGEQTS